jgi:hypothetical protein
VASALLALGLAATAARAEETPPTSGDATPGVVCVTRALRIGAAEVNGTSRRCEDSATREVTTTVTFDSPAEDGAPVSSTPLPDDQGSDATETSDPQP